MDAVPETTPVGDLRVALGGFADIHFLRGFVNSVFFTLFVQTWDAHGYRNAVEYLKQPKYRGFLLGWLLFNLFCSFGLFFVDSATIVSLVNPFHATVIGPAYFGYILWRCRREGCSYREFLGNRFHRPVSAFPRFVFELAHLLRCALWAVLRHVYSDDAGNTGKTRTRHLTFLKRGF
eukprot:GEMP01114032.1.p1 GENE.GEMP01114032.1~~GEMP01114032.1.p1  ORF type:complete len:177 (+),score=18.00 GEMP01114032.1:135-665(+)